MAIGKLIKEAGEHPGALLPLLAIPAILGVHAAHPMRPVTQALQQEIFGDPNGLGTYAKAYVGTAISDQWLTGTQQSQLAELNAPQRTTGLGPGPSGQIVFGMYNSRLGGP